MTTNIEMDDLSSSSSKPTISNNDDRELHEDDQADNTVAVWAWVSASLLSLLSMPLLLFPRFLLFLATPASDSDFQHTVTPLEKFLSANFAIFLIAISITLVLYIPSAPPIEPRRRRETLGHPLLGPLTGASLLAAFMSYNTKNLGSLTFCFFIFTAVIGGWGMWVVMFEGSSRISKKTGADKRTSAFLFGNKSAASAQKKEWKKAQPNR